MTVDSGAAGNMVQILADLPDFLREQIIRKRLQEFVIFEESDKRETISMALNAASSINEHKLTVLVRTWMDVLSEFDPSTIVLMLRLYCEEISRDQTTIKKLNMDCLIRAFTALEEVKKQKFIDCLKESMFSIPSRHKIIEIMPSIAIEILEMK
jgi:hypothetical protein